MRIRLDKILAANGIGTRKEIRNLLRKQQYTVNGVRITDPSVLIDPAADTVCCNDTALNLKTQCFLMLHKPAGVVTSTDDPVHTTVMELLSPPFSQMKLFPIGRLDKDTEGLLIITNDGALTHRLTAPKSHCVKTYYIETAQPFTENEFTEWQKKCADGLILAQGLHCMPAYLELPAPEIIRHYGRPEHFPKEEAAERYILVIHIYEGKYHQVKKMIRALGNEVAYLKRIGMGKLLLDPTLPCGSCRELTLEEQEALTRTDCE